MTNPPKKPLHSFDTANDRKSKNHDPAPESARSCLWRFVSIGAWTGLILVLLLLGARTWFLAQIDPARLATFDRYENDIVTLPPDWQTAAELPPIKAVEFHEEFYQEMQRLRAKYPDLFDSSYSTRTLVSRVRAGDHLTTTELTMLTAYRPEFNALVEKTSAAVSIPGYTFNFPLYGTPNFLELQTFTKNAGVMALLRARDGHCMEAMDIACLPLKLVRREARSWIITHLIAYSIINISSDTIYAVAENCEDVYVLRHGLALMNDVSDVAHLQHLELLQYTDWASNLAAMKATGYPVDLSPQPLADYSDQAWEIYSPKFNSWLVENLPPNDMRVKVARKNLDAWKKQLADADTFEKKLMTHGFAHRGWVEILLGYKAITFYMASANNWEDVPYRARVATANFDLARLRIAQRIAEVEALSDNATTHTTTAVVAVSSSPLTLGPEAIAATISTIPDDPFSTATFRFSKTQNRFYSIGPDKDDDAMKIEYDASNGTVSDGDIFLTP